MSQKLKRDFFLRPSEVVAQDILGKCLVHNSPQGLISGKIIEVEAYPANIDGVSHGNKRTKRTGVMYKIGGFVYVYLIYGIHIQFAVVVNKKDIPEVVFIRSAIPKEGIEIMIKNYGKDIENLNRLARSPGNLCKSFGINLEHYGEDLTGSVIFIENHGNKVVPQRIRKTKRIGINKKLKGYDNKLRFKIK